ncbi:hypothetical protein [Aurantimonas endophytica]|uniref:Uncharacterized protein n=2 Tax=Aurantimonas endophytica TaxID=1522175 RepID=A0A7W6HHI5_9HYPH|nr:hypothetical protein [Aurantimonas endophytica]MBB4005302.1 hypothetical protein [Aurantimonas endophytica]MCO6406036.1 hypothetical protein [Aurantimonas endophytica]
MKKTAIISAMLIGASSFAMPAFAQTGAPDVPGSEAVIQENNAAEREAVAAEPGTSSAPTSGTPESATIVPGNDAERDLNNAAERESVAEGTDANTTSATTPATPSADAPIVPGSGATFSPDNAPESQEGEALQDESSTEAVQ